VGEQGSAFVKGGLGCLGAFLVIGFIAVVLGGRVRINLGGAICLFVCGGLIGLLVFSIYNKGRNDGGRPPPPYDPHGGGI
jgi:hypothetical protein